MRLALLIALIGAACAAETWKTVDVDRTVDVSSQIVKIATLYTFENTGTADQKTVQVALTSDEQETLSYIGAQIDGVKGKLKVSKDTTPAKDGFQLYKIDLRSPVAKGQQIKIRLNVRLTHALTPLPTKIAQSESQFVVYQGGAYVSSPYAVASQKTVVKTASGGKTLSATTVAPSKQEQERIVYGPYSNIAAFEQKLIRVHAENNSPFVVATLVVRTIEISHWGNIAVEEYIELVHKGAELKGTFSRLDHQMDRRGRRMPALQQFTTVLPATARDIYYRDEIGNISTSAVRVRAESVDVEIKPRFPLFGGWRTSYVLGYNVPSHEYLFNKGNQYALKMRLLDHVFENIVVEKVVTKIIMPEHVRKIKLTTPYPVERKADELKPTYLDTTGRLVATTVKENLVGEHIQSFTLSYEFEFKDMLREPLLASAFFFAIFLALIIYMRFDFTIVVDPALEARERVQARLSALSKGVDRKQFAYRNIVEAAETYKSTRDSGALTAGKQEFVKERNDANEKLSELIAGVKAVSAEAAEKAQELLKCDKAAFDAVDNYIRAVEKSTSKTPSQEENSFLSKIEEARNKAENVLAGL